MVKVEPPFIFTKEDEPMNPNDMLLSMLANITSSPSQGLVPENEGGSNEDLAQSILRSLLAEPLKISNSIKGPLPAAVEKREESPKPLSSLSALNPTLASALSGMIGKKEYVCKVDAPPVKRLLDENASISRRRSGPVKLEGPVVPLHIQRHAGETLHLPSSHKVVYNGLETQVPDEIRCHLCNHPMKMCYRKSKYKQEIREYPAYRCLRKGCQTFRAIRKILDPDPFPSPQMKKKQEQSILRDILSAPSNQMPTENCPPIKKKKENSDGTLIFVPVSLTPVQMTKLRQLAFDILQAEGVLEENATLPMVTSTHLTEEEVKKKLATEAGAQEIRNQLLEASASEDKWYPAEVSVLIRLDSLEYGYRKEEPVSRGAPALVFKEEKFSLC